MYCIFHLPRCGSHYLHSLLNTSLSLLNPIHMKDDIEPFNPAFNTVQTVQEKYQQFISRTPHPVVKMVINHYPELAEDFLRHPGYTTLFIKPKDYRKRLLKALVEKHFKTYSGGSDRKKIREPFVGTLEFSDELIRERFLHYSIHMKYENKCDYVFYDEDIFENPQSIQTLFNLPVTIPKYKRVAPFYDDEIMLISKEQFNTQYNRISQEILGEVI